MITVHDLDGNKESIYVVDIDVHIHEEPKKMARYCDLPWRKSLELMEEEEGRYVDIPGFSPGGGRLDPPFPGGYGPRKILNADQATRQLKSIGVDIGVLFPDHLLTLPMQPKKDYAAAIARAYNAWLVEEWLSDRDTLRGAIVAAPQDPVDAARQIEKYAQNTKIVGICLPCAGVSPLYGDTTYDPIYETAEKMDLPLILHSASVVHPNFPFNMHAYDTSMARHALSHPFSIMANLVNIVTNAISVRYPNLRIAFVEAGISWIPFIMWRLDKAYTEQRRQVPQLRTKPSSYIRGYYFGTHPIEEPNNKSELAAVINLFGGQENIMFASDWPHHDFDLPQSTASLPLPLDTKRKIMSENAIKFFRMKRHE